MNDPLHLDVVFSAEDIRKLFKCVAVLRDGIIEPGQLERLREICTSVDCWRLLLSMIPLDKLSFHLESRNAARGSYPPAFGVVSKLCEPDVEKE